MKKPRYYIMDLNNYTNEFLIEIILWQQEELKKISQSNENTHKTVEVKSDE